jgi:hypothetical protein
MSALFVLLVAVLAVLVVTARRVWGHLLSPAVLLGVCWLGPAAVVASGIIRYHPISNLGWGLIIGSYAAFLAGCLMQVSQAGGQGLASDEASFLRRLRGRFSPDALWLVILFYAGAAVVGGALLSREYLGMGLGYISEHVLELRGGFYRSGIGLLYRCAGAAAILACFHLLAVRRRRGWAVPLLLTAMGLTLLTLEKTFFIETILGVTVTSLIVTHPPCITPRRSAMRLAAVVVLTALVAMSFFVGYTNFKSPYYGGDHQFWVSDGYIRLPWGLRTLGNPLKYLTSGYIAFDQYLHHNAAEERGWGRESFNLLYVVAGKLYPIEVPEWGEPFALTPLPTNVTTYLGRIYRDFGILGCLVLPFLMGICYQWVYRHAARGDPLFLVLYGGGSWILFVSFFSFHLFRTPFCITISYLGIAMMLARTRPEGPQAA